jgi:hypothetical protein
MGVGISPIVAREIMREHTAELNRNAERARLARLAEGERPTTHRVRATVVALAVLITGVIGALQLG